MVCFYMCSVLGISAGLDPGIQVAASVIRNGTDTSLFNVSKNGTKLDRVNTIADISCLLI